jgi:hypothetical protein
VIVDDATVWLNPGGFRGPGTSDGTWASTWASTWVKHLGPVLMTNETRAATGRNAAGGAWLAQARRALAALLLAVPVVLLLQAVFALSLAGMRHITDLESVRGHIRAAFDDGVLADDKVPKIWILRGGHQFTECVGLNVAIDPQRDAWRSVLVPKLHFGMVDPCFELHKAVQGAGAAAELTDYSRYWHGYRLLLWPVLEEHGVLALRLVTALMVAAGATVFFLGSRAVIGFTPAAILFLVLFSLTDLWRIWRVASHGLSMFVILAGAGAFALLLRRSSSQTLWIVTAAALGAVFNFFDFMINPPMMPMLMAFFALAVTVDARGRGGLNPLPLAAAIAAAWFLGYAGTWATKWALSIWLSDQPSAAGSGILDQILFRLYGLEAGSTMFRIPLVPTLSMILKAFESVGTVAVVVIIAAVHAHASAHRAGFDRRRFLTLISPVLIVFVWFELLSNHTQLHPNFVYRSASAAIALVLAAAVMATNAPVSLGLLWSNLRAQLRRAKPV